MYKLSALSLVLLFIFNCTSKEKSFSVLIFGKYGEFIEEKENIKLGQKIKNKSNGQYIVIEDQKKKIRGIHVVTKEENEVVLDTQSTTNASEITSCVGISKDGLYIQKNWVPKDQPYPQCFELQKWGSFYEIKTSDIQIKYPGPDKTIEISDKSISDHDFKKIISIINPQYLDYYQILTKPIQFKILKRSSSKENAKITIALPEPLSSKYKKEDLVVLSLTRPLLYQDGKEYKKEGGLSLQDWIKQNFEDLELPTGHDKPVTRISFNIPSSLAEGITIVIARRRKIKASTYEVFQLLPGTGGTPSRAHLATLHLYYKPFVQHIPDIIQYLPKIWNVYKEKGFHVDHVRTPISISLVEYSAGKQALGRAYLDGSIELAYHYILPIFLFVDPKPKAIEEALLPTLAHELFHIISLAYNNPIERMDKFKNIEESAARYWEREMFPHVNNIDDFSDAASWIFLNTETDSIFDMMHCISTAPFFRDIPLEYISLFLAASPSFFQECYEKEKKRRDILYNSEIKIGSPEWKSDLDERFDEYVLYSSFFQWAASLRPHFVREIYNEYDERSKNENITTRAIIQEKIQDVLRTPPRNTPSRVEEKINQKYTALFLDPENPLLEYWAQVILLQNYPTDREHPTYYCPHASRFSDIPCEYYPHRYHFARYDLLNFETEYKMLPGSSESSELSEKRYLQEHSAFPTLFVSKDGTEGEKFGEKTSFGTVYKFESNYVSPRHPFTARVIRVFPMGSDLKTGKLHIHFEKEVGRFDKIGYMVFQSFNNAFSLLHHGSLSEFNSEGPLKKLISDVNCDEDSCPVFYVLLANSDFDYQRYDPSNQHRNLFDLKSDFSTSPDTGNKLVSLFEKNLPKLSVSIKITKEKGGVQKLTCNEGWFGAYFAEMAESAYTKLDDYKMKTWNLKNVLFQLGDSKRQLKWERSDDGKIARISLPEISELNEAALDKELAKKNLNFTVSAQSWSQIFSHQNESALTLPIKDELNMPAQLKMNEESEQDSFNFSGSLPYKALSSGSFMRITGREGCSPPQSLKIAYVGRIENAEKISSNFRTDYVYFEVVPKLRHPTNLSRVTLRNLKDGTEYHNEPTNLPTDERFQSSIGWIVAFPKKNIVQGQKYKLVIPHISFKYTAHESQNTYTPGCADPSSATCKTLALVTPYEFEFEITQ